MPDEKTILHIEDNFENKRLVDLLVTKGYISKYKTEKKGVLDHFQIKPLLKNAIELLS